MTGGIGARLRTARVVAGPPLRWVHSALNGNWRHKRVRRLPPRRSIAIETPDGLRLSACLYATGARIGPGMLILHGWDPLGGRHGYYVALATALQACGITVLTLNLRGYPGSDVPADPHEFNLAALTSDARAGLARLRSLPAVDPERLILFGHSYGAGLVIPVLAEEPDVWRAVVHGPSIWVEERITGPEGPQRDFFHERYWRYMRLAEPVPLEVYLRVKQDLYLPTQIEMLQPGHAPLLLLDGGAEGADTHRFLAMLREQLPPPVTYFTIPGADHFCNSAALGPVLIWDQSTIGAEVDFLMHWMAQPSEACLESSRTQAGTIVDTGVVE